MTETIYREDEVYLTEDQVNDAHTASEKASIAYYLIRRLQKNETVRSGERIDDVWSNCIKELEPFTHLTVCG